MEAAQEAVPRQRRRRSERGAGAEAAREFDILATVLVEAMRFNPALSPGQWRYARRSGDIAPKTWRRRRVPADSVLLVSTMSALRDRRSFPRPGQFELNRRGASELVFGVGPHSCLGRTVSMALLQAMFGVLLRQPGLSRAPGPEGQLLRIGAYPRRLALVFGPVAAPAVQSMVVVCVPIRASAHRGELEQRIRDLGNPAGTAIAEALTGTGIVHFASLSLIDAGGPGSRCPICC